MKRTERTFAVFLKNDKEEWLMKARKCADMSNSDKYRRLFDGHRKEIMKYIRQFLWILLFSFAGEVLKYVIPLPVPASIYGLVLLFLALLTGVLHVESVKEVSVFLIEIMPLMFIPAAVELLESWSALNGILIQILTATMASTVLVMGVSGLVTQKLIRKKQREKA